MEEIMTKKYPMPFPKSKSLPDYTHQECLNLIASDRALLVIDFLRRKGLDVCSLEVEIEYAKILDEKATRKQPWTDNEWYEKTASLFGAAGFSGIGMKLIELVHRYFLNEKG